MQVDSQFELSSAELRQVSRIRFGVLSPDEVKAMSVCEVATPFTYDNGIPKDGGLLDLRMGTMERNIRCKSCAGDMRSCPGHFGHIELVKPCLHIGLVPIIAKIMKCVCFHCSSLLLSSDNPKWHATMRIKKPAKRLQAMLKVCQGMKRCNGGFDVDAAAAAEDQDMDLGAGDGPAKRKASGCGNILPKYRVESGYEVLIEFPEQADAMLEGSVDRKKPLSASRIHEIFKRISDDDVRALGFDPLYARPDWFVITVLAVPPPAVRPSVMFNSSARSSDDLTYKLSDIVKANQALRTQELQGAAEHILQDYTRLLQWHVSTLMDNEISGQPQSFQRSGKPIKSIRQRIVGKGGRVRGNLMGKRVDFSARSVITPDPNLGIDQLGVPRSIALNMTFPEVVTRFNIARMRELVKNGPNVHPGAKTIIRDDGKIVDLRYIKKVSDVHLEIGYKVERMIVDGDPIIFNRQPSLHKMSMMGHKVKVFPWSTFRLNLSCTTPYNADFDGDEMNMHVPQSMGTRAEVLNIILSPRQVVSPQANKPVMGIVQDTLLGVMKFTFRDTFITRDLTYNILMHLESWDGRVPIPAILKPQPMWTGKQLFSCLLPKINMSNTSNNHPDGEHGIMSVGDTLVLVEMGELLQGTIDKRTVGNSQGSLIHLIWLEYGPFRCAQFFTEVQKVVNHWLINHGFSIGIGDAVASSSVLAEIEQTISHAKTEVSNIINRARAGKLERTPGRSVNETFEGEVNGVLNKATDSCGKLVKKALLQTNNVNAMVSSGSKGNAINICQIIAAVGQQNVSGKRIPFGFRNRSLPHFNKYDLGPESKGFVENSYLKGLTPQEFFFHAMGGREGLVDTAVKTAETGYIQRRLVKAMEDVMVQYDASVRNALGEIIQFVYGEDGMDGCFIEKQKLDSAKMDDHQIRSAYYIDLANPDSLDSWLSADIKETLMRDPNAHHILQSEYDAIEHDRIMLKDRVLKVGDDGVYLPVNMKRLIWNAQKRFRVEGAANANDRSTLSPLVVIDQLSEMCDKLVVIKGADVLSCEAQNNATLLFKTMLRSTFASKRVIKDYNLSSDAFAWLLGEVEARFNQALAHPGEMIGSIAAQSIGEPATQMTLNSLDWTEQIVLRVDGIWRTVPIGAWIDGLMQCGPSPPKLLSQVELDAALTSTVETNLILDDTEDAATDADGHAAWRGLTNDEAAENNVCVAHEIVSVAPSVVLRAIPLATSTQVVLHLPGSLSPEWPLESALSSIDVTLGWIALEMRPAPSAAGEAQLFASVRQASMHAALATGAKAIVAFGDSVQNNWRESDLLCERSQPVALTNGISFYNAVRSHDRRAVTVVQCARPSLASLHQLRVALTAAARAVVNPVELQDWAVQIDRVQLRALAAQQVAGSIYTNTNVQRVADGSSSAEMGDTRYLATDDQQVFVPSVTPDGEVVMRAVTAVTKHLPVNEDGTSTLLRITTRANRVTVATKAKSFLTRVDGQLVATRGDALAVGMRLPVAFQLPDGANTTTTIDIATSDDTKDPIPSNDKLALDAVAGFFFGAYVADGRASHSQVMIANTHAVESQQRVSEFVERIADDSDSAVPEKSEKVWLNSSLCVPSSRLATVLRAHCGASSSSKRVPAFAYNAPDEFVRGFVDGCFSCAGTVDKDCIAIDTVSEELVDGMQLLLTRFGVFSCKEACSPCSQAGNYIRLAIRDANVHRFTTAFAFTNPSHQSAASSLALETAHLENGRHDKIPGCSDMPAALKLLLDQETQPDRRDELATGLVSRSKLRGLLEQAAVADEADSVLAAVDSSIYFDEIMSIECVQPTHAYVYDLTVADTKTFQLRNGLMMYDTFHYAGVSSKNVTLGVPRLREIIDVASTCNTPSLTIYLKPAFSSDADAAKKVLNQLEFTTLRSVTERTEIYYDPIPEETCVEEDRDFMAFYFEIPDDDFSMDNASPWMLRIVLDRKKKESKDLSNNDIAEHINNEWKGDLKCIFSNDNAAKLVLQIRFKNDEADKDGGVDDSNDDDVFLKKVEESLLTTMELRGIKGITKVFLRQDKVASFTDTGKYQKDKEEWVLDSEGVALLRVMCVPEVNHRVINSNVITEMFDVLGIEAARASVLKELRAVIEFDGAYVNYRHLAMLCDAMTFRGHLMSINRHGINRADSGALMRCSFEETVEILVQAAAFSELDTLRGVSENIMLGNMPPLGTNSFKLFLNQPMLEQYAIDEPDATRLFTSMYSMDGADGSLAMAPGTPMQNFGASMSPSGAFTPSGGAFSPAMGAFSPSAPFSPGGGGGGAGGGFSPQSPTYSPTSPNTYSPTSPAYSPTSPAHGGAAYSPTSPAYSPTSPAHGGASYSPTSPAYSPTSPGRSGPGASYSPTSPNYSPTSPSGPGGNYSPTSPSYSPTSPGQSGGASYSPTSPSYSPTSPQSGGGASYSPTSPSYSPTSPGQSGGASYSPTSPNYSPTSPHSGPGGSYSPTSPSYSPTSPSYSPTSPHAHAGGGATSYSPTSPSYSPTSPGYSPDGTKEEK